MKSVMVAKKSNVRILTNWYWLLVSFYTESHVLVDASSVSSCNMSMRAYI